MLDDEVPLAGFALSLVTDGDENKQLGRLGIEQWPSGPGQPGDCRPWQVDPWLGLRIWFCDNTTLRRLSFFRYGIVGQLQTYSFARVLTKRTRATEYVAHATRPFARHSLSVNFRAAFPLLHGPIPCPALPAGANQIQNQSTAPCPRKKINTRKNSVPIPTRPSTASSTRRWAASSWTSSTASTSRAKSRRNRASNWPPKACAAGESSRLAKMTCLSIWAARARGSPR